MKNFKTQISVVIAIITGIFFIAAPNGSNAQANYKLFPGKDVLVKVLGSSNIHDWTMTSSVMESHGEFKFDDGNLRSLGSFSFSVDAKSLKSEHESMDNRTYKTIKADQYPKITYKLNSGVVTLLQKNKYLIKATGDLTIAGVTQTIVLNVTATVNADNTITCTGSQKIKLTDYKIEPPSFMLGAMKVTNDLTIQYNLQYRNNQLITKN